MTIRSFISDFKLLPLSSKITISFIFILVFVHLEIPVVNHYFFRTFGYDYAVYNFAFFDYAHFRITPCPIYHQDYPITFLQDHFSLTLLFLSPLYWIFSPLLGTYSLLFIQFLFIAGGALATFKLIAEKFESVNWGFVACLAYLLAYSRFSAYTNDCNLVIIGSAVVPVFLYFFHRGKFFITALCFVFLLFNREDFSLGLFFLSIFLFFQEQTKKKKWWAIGLAVISLIVFYLNFSLFIPALEDENKKFSLFNYGALGKNPLEAFQFSLSHPVNFFQLFYQNASGSVSEHKIIYYYLLVFSGAVFLIFRPLYFIPLIPLLAKKMLNDDPSRYGFESYHGVEIASLLPLLLFSAFYEWKNRRLARSAAIVCLISVIGSSMYFLKTSDSVSPDFNKVDIFRSSFYKTENFSLSNLNYMLNSIPDSAAVCASGRIAARLAFREKIYYYPKIADAEFLVLFRNTDFFPAPEEHYKRILVKLIKSKQWQVLLADDELILLQRI